MRLIQLGEYNEHTMELARPVYDRQRRILLATGRRIHPKYLERLEEMDIRYLFVEDSVSKGITMDEMVEMPSWLDAIEQLQVIYRTISDSKEIPIRELQALVNRLLMEVNKRKVILLIPTTVIADELRPYAHAVNVTLLSLMLGKKLLYSQPQMRDLGMGAILHDVGKLFTDQYSEHPVAGFEFLRKNREISLVSAHIAYQHHEAISGEGFPRCLKDQEILEVAQVCAVANMFENLISKQQMLPHEVMEWIMTKTNVEISEKIVTLFVQSIPSYAPGTSVMINHSRPAIVTKIQSHLHRPAIRFLDTGEEVSLEENLTLMITGIK